MYRRNQRGYNWISLRPPLEEGEQTIDEMAVLVQAWKLGDQLEVYDFQNDIIRVVRYFLGQYPYHCNPFVHHSDFMEGLANTKLYRLLVAMLGRDLFAFHKSREVEDILSKLDADVRAAVQESMRLYSGQLFDWLRGLTCFEYKKGENQQKTKRLDETVIEINKATNNIDLNEFLVLPFRGYRLPERP